MTVFQLVIAVVALVGLFIFAAKYFYLLGAERGFVLASLGYDLGTDTSLLLSEFERSAIYEVRHSAALYKRKYE